MNSLSRVFPLFQRKSGCIGEEFVNKMNNLSIEMQDFMQNDILVTVQPCAFISCRIVQIG